MNNPAVIANIKKTEAFHKNKNLLPIKNVAYKFGEFQSVRNEFLSKELLENINRMSTHWRPKL